MSWTAHFQNRKISSEFWYAIYLTKGLHLIRRYIKHFLICCPLLTWYSNWFKSGLAFTLNEVKHRNFCNSYLQLFWVSVLCKFRHISIDETQTLLYYDAKEPLQISHACTIGWGFFEGEFWSYNKLNILFSSSNTQFYESRISISPI